MANDYFAIGSVVSCKTCYNEIIEGEVVAYDHGTNMLALKCKSDTGKHSDIQMINLKYLCDSGIRVISEPTGTCAPLASIDLQKIAKRKQHNIEEARRKIDYIGIGVTPKAQALFNTILKTIRDVKWDGDKIVFMDQVVISPPYAVDDCRLIKESGKQALDHVRKICINHGMASYLPNGSYNTRIQRYNEHFLLRGVCDICSSYVDIWNQWREWKKITKHCQEEGQGELRKSQSASPTSSVSS